MLLPKGRSIDVVKVMVVQVIVKTVILLGANVAGQLVIPVNVRLKAVVLYSTLLVATVESQYVSTPSTFVLGELGFVIPYTTIMITVEAVIFDEDVVKFTVNIRVMLSNRHDCERTAPGNNVTEQVGDIGTVTSAGKVFISTEGEVPRPLAIVMEKVA